MWRLTLVLAALAATASPAVAQPVLSGRVVEELSGDPIPRAEVLFADSEGLVLATTVSDAAGRFAIASPVAGILVLQARVEGFEPVTTRVRLEAEQHAEVTIEMIPAAIEVAGLTVTVDALGETRKELARWGVLLDDLGERFIAEEAIEARFGSRDLGEVIGSEALPGVTAHRGENTVPGLGNFLCISMTRGRSGAGFTRCALTVVDGLPIPPEAAADIPIETLRAIVVLHPVEASLVYGTAGGGGAVLLFRK